MIHGRDYMAKGMEKKFSEPSAETRCSFYLAFNITPDEQVALEEQYQTIDLVWQKPAPIELTEVYTILSQF
jgi:hypothetical protein